MKSLGMTLVIFIFGVVSNAHGQTKLQMVTNRLFDMNTPAGVCRHVGPQDLVQSETDNRGGINAFCYFIEQGGKFQGSGEFGKLFIQTTGAWAFEGNSCQPDVFFRVLCVRSN